MRFGLQPVFRYPWVARAPGDFAGIAPRDYEKQWCPRGYLTAEVLGISYGGRTYQCPILKVNTTNSGIADGNGRMTPPQRGQNERLSQMLKHGLGRQI